MGIFPVDEHHHAQLALEGDVPDQGGIEMDMVTLLQRPKVLAAMQILKVDLAVIFAPARRDASDTGRYRESDNWHRHAVS